MNGSNAAPGLLDIPGVRARGASDGARDRICVPILSFDAVDTTTAVELYHKAGIADRARNLDV